VKILHLIAGIDPKSGGPTRSVTGLCRALSLSGVETTLFVHSSEHTLSKPEHVRFLTGQGVSISKVFQDAKRVIDDIKPDIIHLHGLWMMSNHAAIRCACRRNIPIVLSTRGMLDPWALSQKAVKKNIALCLYQRSDLRRVACFHATAQQEAENIRRQQCSQPIVVVPNGIDCPEVMPAKNLRADGRRVALFLSRLHPGKGLLDLVSAWGCVRPKGWRMRIIGPDVCGHRAVVEAEIARLGLQGDFEFSGEMDDEAKWQEYANANLFIHPSHSENFGISIAEALAAGLPVITTKGTPWQELLGSSASSSVRYCDSELVGERETGNSKRETSESESHTHALLNSLTNELARPGRAGWWIDIGVEPLVEALREAMSVADAVRNVMGENGRQLVKAKYTWPAIAVEMKQVYEWVLNGGINPSCLYLD